jgi:hypothetical protein
MIFVLVMSTGVNVSFVTDFDFSHDSCVRRNSLIPFTLQAYERFLPEQVQFCEERVKNFKINMSVRQLTSTRKRQLSFTGNGRYSVLKTSSSSRAPTTLISSETTFPIAAASMTSDVSPNAPTVGEAVAPIYIFFRTGPSSTHSLQRYKTLVLSISFSSCSFRCNLCLNFQCRVLFTFLYFGPFTPFFFSVFLCSLIIRVGATTNLEGGSGRSIDLL